ncbi:homoserine dehydrogenase [Aminithiophilus ramosus]|uniref:Homoserine dehydrogenase n=2 Tax=Synergistales TaxID=649776 RepID=A0A9Q7AE70_9BACT|nr:homoserine dehydrogenase [Aminithiophilus ramosus]QTX32699.1 homoserine dehydrogenase [Aminithiophilus ramosus]QVL36575.1 homoserine dehydrogenase [Synergistota bacterium]
MWKIGLVGCGNVGLGLLRILEAKRGDLENRYGFTYAVTGVVDPFRGSVGDERGLDVAALLAAADGGKSFRGLGDPIDLDWLLEGRANVIAEATPTNLVDAMPGLDHIRRALAAGCHVVSTNKGPVSLALPELQALARERGVQYRIEGVLLSGTPAINLAGEALAGCDILSVQGIVNGTTNFILTRMEEGADYGAALAEAQALGYAETDPTADVEGWDAAVKAQVMANVFLGQSLAVDDVERLGISHLTGADIDAARAKGCRLKLIAEVERSGEGVRATVAPRELPLSHPLAGVSGAINALTFRTDHLGDVTIVGPGAGRVETGQALLVDLLALNR